MNFIISRRNLFGAQGLAKVFKCLQESPQPQPLPTYESTVELIKHFHRLHTDDAFDLPYYRHPMDAANYFKQLYPIVIGGEAPEDEVFAILLHDVPEDSDDIESAEDLRSYRYSDRTIWMVDKYTEPKKDPNDNRTKQERYDAYTDSIIATGDKALILGKLSDNLDNLTRRQGLLMTRDPWRNNRFAERYSRSIHKYCQALEVDPEKIFSVLDCPVTDLTNYDFSEPAV